MALRGPGAVSNRKSALIEQACIYLMEKAYPEGCTLNRKRQIRKRAEKLNIVNGELYYAPKDKQVAMCFSPSAIRFSVCMSVTSRQTIFARW